MNCNLFRQLGGVAQLFRLIDIASVRYVARASLSPRWHSALRVITQLIVDKETAKARDDLATLLEVMQSARPDACGT